MKTMILFLLVIGCFGSAHAADRDASGILTGQGLKDICETAERSAAVRDLVNVGSCTGYIDATIDALVAMDGATIKMPTTLGQDARIFLAEIKERPELESATAQVALGIALVHHKVIALKAAR